MLHWTALNCLHHTRHKHYNNIEYCFEDFDLNTDVSNCGSCGELLPMGGELDELI